MNWSAICESKNFGVSPTDDSFVVGALSAEAIHMIGLSDLVYFDDQCMNVVHPYTAETSRDTKVEFFARCFNGICGDFYLLPQVNSEIAKKIAGVLSENAYILYMDTDGSTSYVYGLMGVGSQWAIHVAEAFMTIGLLPPLALLKPFLDVITLLTVESSKHVKMLTAFECVLTTINGQRLQYLKEIESHFTQ